MGKVFCIMGKSGSGKDTIFKEIIKDNSLNLKKIVGYTTRPKRVEENDGVEYNFIDDDMINKFIQKNKVIELRKYDTVNGIWYYGTMDDGQINLQTNSYIVISTLESYSSFKKYFGSNNVIPLYIDVDDGIRLQRILNREMSEDSPNYKEICRRFIADSEDFSNKNLKLNGIEKIYSNNNLVECIADVKNNIIKYIK
ncbi:MAG: AAA family ATPase [Sarcina ventriculi]|uniref:Guanylate kinase n=1 Tax=Sarcina ventriculi TaxID=1267 RepID=A0ABM9USD2_SARVE|nr:AAA family ATPase [Sarcina ventriculi]MDO4402242.1 AAA family ATPase [Clostridiaceae bacterium]MBU5323267.1 AAA family ATPase [Sarcina ventriculi]MDY7063424.1 AAA family ATPase [Sarcina ventriculi]CUO21213.1 Guanylate kinase [Sarcina ventriculi]SPZ49879.1 Guanylate kinase [Sarcina ventriculi]